MPPSWLRGIGEHQPKARLPDLEHTDWSRGLALGAGGAPSAFVEGLLSTSNIALHGEISALAVEPVQGYLAVGTSVGSVHLFGEDAVQISWNLRPANKIQHLLFKSGSPILVVIDARDNISIYDLSRNDPATRTKVSSAHHPFQPVQSTTTGAGPSGPLHPDTPMRIGAHTARNAILCAEVSPLHDHLFLGLRDGTLDTYDLDRLSPSPYRVPNLWWEEEEILRKSGVPDAPNRRHVPLIVSIQTHPKDVNQLLLAYEGGVVLLDVKQRNVVRSFQLRHLPGAMGAGVGNPDRMWTERPAPVTCVSWRPDGVLFACGHEDGCISIWHVEDDDRPVMVRTIDTVDVDKPDSTNLDESDNWPQTREPIFKLAWSGFPAQAWMNVERATAQWQTPSTDQGAEKPDEPTTGTILTVLGGATERHPPGLVCLHFPAFSWPASSYWNTKSHDAVAKITQALRRSVVETQGMRYSTNSAVEDFLLVPRDSPFYGMAYDPIAVVTLLAADPSLPPLPPPAAQRGLKAFAFPPPSEANTASQQAAMVSHSRVQLPFPQKILQLPLALSTAGTGAILGAELVAVSTHAYRILTGRVSEQGFAPASAGQQDGSAAHASRASHASTSRLPLRGGEAQPTAVGAGSQSIEAMTSLARAEHHRLLVTWHLDGTVRFADASPHLLLIGKAAVTADGANASIVLDKGFPQPLDSLTIDLRGLIHDRGMMGHPLFDRLRSDASRQRIQTVRFAPEALEVAIAVRSGQVFHFKFGLARFSQTEELEEAVTQDVQQDEAAAIRMSHHGRSASVSQDASHELDTAMAGALQGLDFEPSTQCNSVRGQGPPPRPKRDPKRGSIVNKLGFARQSQDVNASQQRPALSPSSDPALPARGASMPVDEITTLGHLASGHLDGFKPNIVVELFRGEVSALEVSDIGFLAVASGPALAVVDLRGPEMLIREGFGDQKVGNDHSTISREERKTMEEESRSPIRKMRLSICRTVANAVLTPTLLVARDSGFTTLWALTKGSLDVWIAQRTLGSQIDELQRCVDVHVLDMAGNPCSALPTELQRSLREQARDAPEDASRDMNSLLCVGQKSLSLRPGLLGPRIGRADVNEPIKAAGIVDRRGEKVCVAISASSIYIFSLPHLRQITRIQRHNRAHEERLAIAEMSTSLDASGDFIEVANSLDVSMWTVFASSPRPGLPSLMLYKPVALPIAPNAIGSAASGLVNWIGGRSSALTQGAQFDEMLAGEKRPEAPRLPEPKYVQLLAEQEAARQRSQPDSARTSMQGPQRSAVAGASTQSSRTAQETQAAYGTAGWTADLARQRGEMMSSLEQGLSNLERGASGWVKSAKQEMVKQAARDKLGKLF